MDGDLTLKCSSFTKRDLFAGSDTLTVTASDVSSSISVTLIFTPGYVMLTVYNSGDLIERIPLQPRFDGVVITASQSSLKISNHNSSGVEFQFQLDPSADPTEILDKIYNLK